MQLSPWLFDTPFTLTSHCPTLLRLKQLTGHDAVDHGSQAVSPLTYLSSDAVDVCMVAEGQRAAKGEGREFMHHRSNELILAVLQQESLQAVGSFEFLLIEQQAGSINRCPVDLITPASECIVVFKRDSPWVDFGMAGETRGLIAMILDSLL